MGDNWEIEQKRTELDEIHCSIDGHLHRRPDGYCAKDDRRSLTQGQLSLSALQADELMFSLRWLT